MSGILAMGAHDVFTRGRTPAHIHQRRRRYPQQKHTDPLGFQVIGAPPAQEHPTDSYQYEGNIEDFRMYVYNSQTMVGVPEPVTIENQRYAEPQFRRTDLKQRELYERASSQHRQTANAVRSHHQAQVSTQYHNFRTFGGEAVADCTAEQFGFNAIEYSCNPDTSVTGDMNFSTSHHRSTRFAHHRRRTMDSGFEPQLRFNATTPTVNTASSYLSRPLSSPSFQYSGSPAAHEVTVNDSHQYQKEHIQHRADPSHASIAQLGNPQSHSQNEFIPNVHARQDDTEHQNIDALPGFTSAPTVQQHQHQHSSSHSRQNIVVALDIPNQIVNENSISRDGHGTAKSRTNRDHVSRIQGNLNRSLYIDYRKPSDASRSEDFQRRPRSYEERNSREKTGPVLNDDDASKHKGRREQSRHQASGMFQDSSTHLPVNEYCVQNSHHIVRNNDLVDRNTKLLPVKDRPGREVENPTPVTSTSNGIDQSQAERRHTRQSSAVERDGVDHVGAHLLESVQDQSVSLSSSQSHALRLQQRRYMDDSSQGRRDNCLVCDDSQGFIGSSVPCDSALKNDEFTGQKNTLVPIATFPVQSSGDPVAENEASSDPIQDDSVLLSNNSAGSQDLSFDELDVALARIAFRALGARDAEKLRRLAEAVQPEEVPNRVRAAAEIFAHTVLVAIDSAAGLPNPKEEEEAQESVPSASTRRVSLLLQRAKDKSEQSEKGGLGPFKVKRRHTDLAAKSASSQIVPSIDGDSARPSDDSEIKLARRSTSFLKRSFGRLPTRRSASGYMSTLHRNDDADADLTMGLKMECRFNSPSPQPARTLDDAIENTISEFSQVATAFADLASSHRVAVAAVCLDAIRDLVEPITNIEKRFSRGIGNAVTRSQNIASRIARLATAKNRQSSSLGREDAESVAALKELGSTAVALTDRIGIVAREGLYESRHAVEILATRASRGSFPAVIASADPHHSISGHHHLLLQKDDKRYRPAAMLNKLDCRAAELAVIISSYHEHVLAAVETAQRSIRRSPDSCSFVVLQPEISDEKLPKKSRRRRREGSK